jgi:hypothetical protein
VALRSSQAPHGSTKLSFCGTVRLGFDPVRQWWCSFLRENPNEPRHQGRGLPKFYPPLQHEPRFQCTAPERRPRPPPLAILRERLFLNSGSERVPLAIRDMRRRNGERRSRAPKSRRGFSFPMHGQSGAIDLAMSDRTLRPRDVRDVGSPHVDPNQCASVVKEDLARRLFRLSGRPIGRPLMFRLSVALQHGPGGGVQLGPHL